ncbi:MAG: hypothetical protein N3A66_04950, partial [Planctomycetota bacterium]|nr:hypothetical protein [Planctomycetota bacterium]
YIPGSSSIPIGPDGKGNLYSTYMYLPWRGMLTQAHLRFGPTELREVHPYRPDIMQRIAGRWQKRFAVFADAVGVERTASWPGSNHGEGKAGCYGGNFAFADGSCKWFPWRWYGANIATAYGSGGWMLSDKCWFADQSQGMIWMPRSATTMDCDFNAGVGTTYVALGIGEAHWSARYVQANGDLLGGPPPW